MAATPLSPSSSSKASTPASPSSSETSTKPAPPETTTGSKSKDVDVPKTNPEPFTYPVEMDIDDPEEMYPTAVDIETTQAGPSPASTTPYYGYEAMDIDTDDTPPAGADTRK